MFLQGIMVVVFIVVKSYAWFDEYNYHDSLQVCAIEGISYWWHLAILSSNQSLIDWLVVECLFTVDHWTTQYNIMQTAHFEVAVWCNTTLKEPNNMHVFIGHVILLITNWFVITWYSENYQSIPACPKCLCHKQIMLTVKESLMC